MNLIQIINTEEGKYLLGKLGQKPEGKIVKITANSFLEHLGGENYRSTFFSRRPIEKIFQPILDKINIAEEYRHIKNKREAFLHYSGLERSNKYPQIYLTTSTFNPVAGANSPVDGQANRNNTSESWAALIAGNGTGSNPSDTQNNIWFTNATSSSNQFQFLLRNFFAFDTSPLGSFATISSATFSVFISAVTNGGLNTVVGLYLGTLASNANVVNADYQGTSGNTTLQSNTTPTTAGISTSAFLDFALNSTGLSNINKTGVTVFGGRFTQDVSGVQPTWVSGQTDSVQGNYADQGANIPKLIINFTRPGGTLDLTSKSW